MNSFGKLTINREGLSLSGHPFKLASGSLHYFRILPEYWSERLSMMKDFGLTAVQTYVPWNLHEPVEGVFDFSEMLNLGSFLHQASRTGLKVLLRPSPYICSECDFGGLPWWLLNKSDIGLRCMDPAFLSAVELYYQRLCAEFIPYLSSHGGPIIMVALENEYGSYGTDTAYLQFLEDILKSNGVDVPLFSADGYGLRWLQNGSLPGNWAGIDYRVESAKAIAHLREFQPDKPPLICEYWSGRASHWGESFERRNIPQVATAFREALELGGQVNFYMFCGGTNFGFFSGANANSSDQYTLGSEPQYRPLVTSYDVDALISEEGYPTEKYYSCRKELDEYLGRPYRPIIPPKRNVQALPALNLVDCTPLFDNLDILSQPKSAITPQNMEKLGQGYGFVLYSTILRGPQLEPLQLHLDGLRDRATVYLDGQYLGSYLTCCPEPDLRIAVNGNLSRLDILVENQGRICYGRHLKDFKGILTGVRWGHAYVYNWTMYPLPFSNLQELSFKKESLNCSQPAFYRGYFEANPGSHTHIRLSGWVKGNVWINKFHLGRYWNVGPQETLYLPGALLKKHNEIIVFEVHHAHSECIIEFIDHAILDGPIRNEFYQM